VSQPLLTGPQASFGVPQKESMKRGKGSAQQERRVTVRWGDAAGNQQRAKRLNEPEEGGKRGVGSSVGGRGR
jgi:hypothetical protein